MEKLKDSSSSASVGVDSQTDWSVVIYRTTTAETQQEIILRAKSFLPADAPVLGASSGPDHYVVAECSTEHDSELIDRVVTATDRNAELVHTAHPWSPLSR